MAKRSPVLGYNHNFKHRGLIFHVQTEDSGVDNPHIFTHLFHGGVIISSRKMDYDAESEEDIVKSLMQSQHKAVLKDLKIGTFDDKIDSYLGNNPDLLPRKNAAATEAEASSQAQVDEAAQRQAAEEAQKKAEAEAANAAAPEPAEAPPEDASTHVARAATEEDLRDAAQRAAAEQAAAMGGDTDDMSAVAKAIAARVDGAGGAEVSGAGDTADISELAAAAQRAAQEKLAAANAARAAAEAARAAAEAAMAEAEAAIAEAEHASGAIPMPNVSSDDTVPVEQVQSQVEMPRRARVPTPLAVPVAVDKGIGDPVVTFSAASAPVEGTGEQSSGVPSGPAVGESSGSYHMGRRQQRATSESVQAARTRGRVSSALGGGKPAGKAANSTPGRSKSSVAVSRPAVIIGGPAKVVGGKKKAAGKKPRQSKGLFGKDLISEKSLDEVIMAYLSEDSNDE